MSAPDKVPTQPDEAHFQICQRAAEQLGRLVDGNGLKADQVRLARHETLVHQVPGFVNVELTPEVATRQFKGNVPQGKVLGHKEAVMQEAAGIVGDVGRDINVQTQVLQAIAEDPGKGFGMEPFKIPLPATAKDYSVVQKCLKCNGLTYYTCNRCNQQGVIPCQACNAQGYSQCQACFGSGQYTRGGGGQGDRVQCARCNGQGRIMCTTCNGQRTTRCPICTGQGRVDCTECDRSGFWTNVYQLTFVAQGQFDLDRQQVPENVLSVIEHLGVKNLGRKGLAQIFRVGLNAKEKMISIPLLAFLPIATAEFTVEGKPYPATIAGLPGQILTIQPLLDTAIKPGINALYKLSKGPMAAEALVEQACRFRLIRQVLGGVTKQSKKQVYQLLQKEYPVGLSEKYAKAAIRYADQAILAMGKGPRMKGLIAGAAASVILDAAYFMGGIRQSIGPTMAQSGHGKHMFIPDLAVWVIGLAATIVAIKMVAGMGLKKMLPDSIQNERGGLPSAGEHAWYAVAATFAGWLALAILGKAGWLVKLLHLVP